MAKAAKNKKKQTRQEKQTRQAKSSPKQSATRSSELTGPTILTIARMALSVLFFILVLIPTLPTRILALILFIAGAISDHIDGRWARSSERVTDLGAFLDPLADKMLVNLALLALTVIGVVPAWVLALILVRDYAVDGMRMMAARKGVTIAANFYGKLKTTLQLTAIIMLLVNLVFNWEWLAVIGGITLFLAVLMTVLSGGDYLAKNWRKVIG